MIQSIRLPLFPSLKIKLWSHFSHELARMVAAGKLDLALVTAIPDTPSLTFLTVAEAPIYIALPKSDAIDHSTELRLEDLRAYDWILPASHVNPHLLEMIQTAATAKGIVAPDTHYIMTAEEASGLVLAYKGAAFLTRDSALRISSDEIAVLPLAEERLKLVTRLAMRSDDKKAVDQRVRSRRRAQDGQGATSATGKHCTSRYDASPLRIAIGPNKSASGGC